MVYTDSLERRVAVLPRLPTLFIGEFPLRLVRPRKVLAPSGSKLYLPIDLQRHGHAQPQTNGLDVGPYLLGEDALQEHRAKSVAAWRRNGGGPRIVWRQRL